MKELEFIPSVGMVQVEKEHFIQISAVGEGPNTRALIYGLTSKGRLFCAVADLRVHESDTAWVLVKPPAFKEVL